MAGDEAGGLQNRHCSLPVTVKQRLCAKYQRAKALAILSDAVSAPVQCFEKSFLFQFVENSKIDKTVWVQVALPIVRKVLRPTLAVVCAITANTVLQAVQRSKVVADDFLRQRRCQPRVGPERMTLAVPSSSVEFPST
jgi:hypothetical protein